MVGLPPKTADGANVDHAVVDGFGNEWAAFDQSAVSREEHERRWLEYFGIFPWDRLPANAEGFDMGCGSGRWARLVAPRVGMLNCIDPAPKALDVARQALTGAANVRFIEGGVGDPVLPEGSQDFGYSLGVLHHIPDTEAGMKACTALLKPGAPFLVYLYYAFDQRPTWFRAIWKASDLLRRGICRMPFAARRGITSVIAAAVYWPLARGAGVLEKLGAPVGNLPLSAYRRNSFYSMRTDALDRFGTRLERRFTRPQIEAMMKASGLKDIRFSDNAPFWVACGAKAG